MHDSACPRKNRLRDALLSGCSGGAADDSAFAFGDSAEPMLQAAKYFVDNQTCLLAPRSRTLRSMPLQGLQEVAGVV